MIVQLINFFGDTSIKQLNVLFCVGGIGWRKPLTVAGCGYSFVTGGSHFGSLLSAEVRKTEIGLIVF